MAVKLLRRGLYSSSKVRPSASAAPAALAHPNIAHLIDGGLTDAGIPFLIMEYVDGPASPPCGGTGLDRRVASDFS
jgi:serine/threonine-protein kinase